jgi:mono/diheme cytochrome c family protein
MKVTRIVVALVSVLALSGVVAVAEDAGKIYDSKCATCHGADARGAEAKTKSLKVEMALLDLLDKDSMAKTEQQWIDITKNGDKKMPKYAGKIPDEDIAAVVKFVRAKAK